jgi:hypothetical protein
MGKSFGRKLIILLILFLISDKANQPPYLKSIYLKVLQHF